MASDIDWAAARDEEIVCYCNQVNKAAIVDAIRMGAYTVPLVKAATQAARGKECKRKHPEARGCDSDIEELLRIYGDGTQVLGGSCGCGCGCS